MIAVVSGGGGFIGSHLTDRLLADGHLVVVVDSFFSGSERNLAHLEGNAKFGLVEMCVAQPEVMEAVRSAVADLAASNGVACEAARIDRIYHLACPASPVTYQVNPLFTLDTNYSGTRHMCELVRASGGRLLLASTSEVYGDPEVHPQVEGYLGNVNCIGTRSCYDEGKRVAETMVMDYNRQHATDVKVVRIFNTYGPRMLFNDGRVVSNFFVQALKRRPITVYGDGSQTRSFCYVADLVEGLTRMMEKSGADERGPVNLGNPGEYTISQLASKVQELVNPDMKNAVEYRTLPSDDPRRRQPDISKAQAVLGGWQPTVSLDEGLRRTAEDFEQRSREDPEADCAHQREAV